jgi:hypothetical protein
MAKTNRDYEVGYGKPPKGTRFKPGQSGNPNGRPKGSKAIATLVQKELKTRIAVTEGGLTKRMTKAEAIVKRLVGIALKGDLRATALTNALSRDLSGSPPAADAPLSPVEQEIFDAIYRPERRKRNEARRRK